MGDTILAMNLDHGGHLTHGSPVNFSGKLYNIVPYGVAARGRAASTTTSCASWPSSIVPKLIQCGTTAYSRTIDFEAFRSIADEVGAVLFADIAHIAGSSRPGCTRAPVGTRARRHHHHPQDPARSARRA